MSTMENGPSKAAVRALLSNRLQSGGDGNGLLSATARTNADLAGVLVPLIGEVGLKALSARALHIAQRAYPGGSTEVSGGEGLVDPVQRWIEGLDPAGASEAVMEMLLALVGLLETFIGESLTMRLLRKAWPEGFPHEERQEPQT